jgi:CRISPR-associated endonuclease Cas3-HD
LQMYAHTPGPNNEWHDLQLHLKSVADRAARYASKFGCTHLGFALGIVHDLAKADPRFQTYLKASFEARPAPKCPHSAPSADAKVGPLRLPRRLGWRRG